MHAVNKLFTVRLSRHRGAEHMYGEDNLLSPCSKLCYCKCLQPRQRINRFTVLIEVTPTAVLPVGLLCWALLIIWRQHFRVGCFAIFGWYVVITMTGFILTLVSTASVTTVSQRDYKHAQDTTKIAGTVIKLTINCLKIRALLPPKRRVYKVCHG